jgi:hypothetical protein
MICVLILFLVNREKGRKNYNKNKQIHPFPQEVQHPLYSYKDASIKYWLYDSDCIHFFLTCKHSSPPEERNAFIFSISLL